MKSIHAPYIPGLDSLDNAADICHVLEAKGSRALIDSANWADQYPYTPLATFTIAHSDKYIYIDFFARGNALRAINTENQSPVSDDSCVEFFVSPTCDNHYWNFEFNCIGAINSSHRSERKNPTRLNADELAQVRRYPSCGNQPFNEKQGLHTWSILIAVPLSLINVQYNGSPIRMTANFYKVAAAASTPHFVSWNPINSEKPDFHRQADFGELILD